MSCPSDVPCWFPITRPVKVEAVHLIPGVFWFLHLITFFLSFDGLPHALDASPRFPFSSCPLLNPFISPPATWLAHCLTSPEPSRATCCSAASCALLASPRRGTTSYRIPPSQPFLLIPNSPPLPTTLFSLDHHRIKLRSAARLNRSLTARYSHSIVNLLLDHLSLVGWYQRYSLTFLSSWASPVASRHPTALLAYHHRRMANRHHQPYGRTQVRAL